MENYYKYLRVKPSDKQKTINEAYKKILKEFTKKNIISENDKKDTNKNKKRLLRFRRLS